MIVYAIDVGSTKKGAFAWAQARSTGDISVSTSIARLVESLESALRGSDQVSLGIEAPLYMPIPANEDALSSGRSGEGSRSMFAPAGSAVCVLGVHQLSWILARIQPCRVATFDPRYWRAAPSTSLLIWEAFVSGSAHSDDHRRDAATAVHAFLRAAGTLRSDLPDDDTPVLNLAGAALLRLGWNSEVCVLRERCVVIKPDRPLSAPLHDVRDQGG